jgi:octaprenyl-diphosphate synthase
VLVGDFLFSRSFQLMVNTGSIDVLRILSDASATIAAGEVLQLTTAGEPSTSVDDYMRVIEGKTAALFSAAAEVGAVIAGRPAAEASALRRYGTELGVAFQLIDDRLDYDADQAALGKTVGDDFREGKVTLPIIIAYQNGDAAERTFWDRTIGDGNVSDSDLAKAQCLLAKHDALAETGRVAIRHAQSASEALSVFPANRHRRALQDIAAFCVERAF